MIDADLLYQKYKGQTLSYDGIPENAGQCAQLAEYVLTDKQYGYGLQPFWGNAIDWWRNYGGSLTAFDKVTDGSVKKGDIVIFNENVGSVYGHIDMAMQDGTVDNFVGADSNWAGNKTVHLVNHVGRQYVIGSLRLKGGQEMISLNALNILYRFRLGRSPDKSAISSYVGKVPFDQVDKRVKASPEYKTFISKYKQAKKVINTQLPTELQ